MPSQRTPTTGFSLDPPSMRLVACVIASFIGLVLSGCEDATSTRATEEVAVWPTGRQVAVAILDETSAIVASESGAILWTGDRGASWFRARVPAIEGLAALSMADDKNGWAVGPGVVLRTEDAGKTWVRQRLPGRAANHDLRAIAALDRERAIALGEGGRRLRTEDAGAVWVDLSDATREGAPALRAIACRPGPQASCLSVGREVLFSGDSGETWIPASVEDAAGLAPVRYRVGGVELDSAAVARIDEAMVRLAGEPVSWRVEAFVSAPELDRVAGDRDPSALFELLDARVEEWVGALEAAGADPEQIVIEGAPPWGYEDHIDDDPEFLSRYWRARLADEPMARVHAQVAFDFASVEIDSEGDVLAVGLGGRVIEADAPEWRLRRGASPGPHDLFDVATVRGGQIVVGRQGAVRLRLSDPVGRGGLSAAPNPTPGDWITPDLGGQGAIFEALRAVDFDESGEWGLAVGDAARLLRSEDAGRAWALLTP